MSSAESRGSKREPHAGDHAATRQWRNLLQIRTVLSRFLVGEIPAASENFIADVLARNQKTNARVEEVIAARWALRGCDSILAHRMPHFDDRMPSAIFETQSRPD